MLTECVKHSEIFNELQRNNRRLTVLAIQQDKKINITRKQRIKIKRRETDEIRAFQKVRRR